jgi:hypothetical protein
MSINTTFVRGKAVSHYYKIYHVRKYKAFTLWSLRSPLSSDPIARDLAQYRAPLAHHIFVSCPLFIRPY